MKIAHTESSAGWGGQEIRILEECRGMSLRGHNVVLLCPTNSTIFHEAKSRNISTMHLPIEKKSIKGILALRKWIRKNSDTDIINTHSSTDSWCAALASLLIFKKIPVVRTRHISSSIPDNYASRWLYSKATKRVVTTGEKLRSQVIAQTGTLPNHVISIPTGIDLNRFKAANKTKVRLKLGLDPQKKYIGIVATLRSWKGHLFLLEALSKVQIDQINLVIVGDGPYRHVIEEKVISLGLHNRVTLVGHQNNPEEWLQTFDYFCLPSYANEGVPQALMQAMLTELPVISTSVGSIPEIVDHMKTGIIVEPQNSNSLYSALILLIMNDDLTEKLGTAARKKGEIFFSFERMINEMESLYSEIVTAHND